MSVQKQYPWLSNHRIAKPCKVKWTDMSGGEKKRFCGQCKLNVYNLSSMTSDEAETLLKNSGGKVCTYFYQRQDGTVLTQDCPVGLKQVYRQRGAIAAALYALSLLTSLPVARAGDSIKGRSIQPPTETMMGGATAVLQPTLGEPMAQPTPKPTATPKPIGKIPPCPRPLLGKPAVKR